MTITRLPLVSVIVSCTRQGKYLQFLVNDLLRQEYPAEALEIILVGSEVNEEEHSVIQDIVNENANIELVRCRNMNVPACYNLGIQQSAGEIIILLDNQTRVKSNLVSKVVARFGELEVSSLYGQRVYSAVSDKPLQLAMKECLTSTFGFKGSFIPGQNPAASSISSPFGCYRRICFEEAGYFSEYLTECFSEDYYEKLLKKGFAAQPCPDIRIIRYVPERLKDLSTLVLNKSFYRPFLVRKNRALTRFSHTLPALFILILMGLWTAGLFDSTYLALFFGVLALYWLILLLVSAATIRKYKRLILMAVMPYVFFVVHGASGWGYLMGIIRFWFPMRLKSKDAG